LSRETLPTHELTEDQVKVLQFELMRIWAITAHKALEDTIGEEAAVRAIAPYFKHSTSAALVNLKARMPNMGDGIKAIAIAGAFCNQVLGIKETVGITDFGVDYRILDCPYCPCCRTFCRVHGEAGIDGFAEISGLEYRGMVHTFPEREGRSCRVILRPTELPKHMIPENPKVLIQIPTFEIPSNESHSYMLQYLGEWWVDATKAFEEVMDQELAEDILREHAFNAGKNEFSPMMSRLGIDRTDPSSWGSLICKMSPISRDGIKVLVANENEYKAEISDCPFAASPIEICQQMEAFYDGACQGIDPELEFHYEEMRTKGDGRCIWTLRRKRPTPRRAPEDALEVLRHRLAKGEISIEEFDEIRKRLID